MARFNGYVRFLWPPKPWKSIAGADCREQCVDNVEHWLRANVFYIAGRKIEFVILAESDGEPNPHDP